MLAAKSEMNNYAAIPLYDEVIVEQEKLRKKRELKRRKKQKMLFKVSCITAIALFTMVSFFILRGYSNISSSRMNITNLEKRKSELEQTRFAMASELEEAKSSVKISEEAMYKLSMDYPSYDQVVYLSLGETEKMVKGN
nr:hypothetical protein [Tissierella sp.]